MLSKDRKPKKITLGFISENNIQELPINEALQSAANDETMALYLINNRIKEIIQHDENISHNNFYLCRSTAAVVHLNNTVNYSGLFNLACNHQSVRNIVMEKYKNQLSSRQLEFLEKIYSSKNTM